MNSTAAVEDEEWESAGLVLEHMKLVRNLVSCHLIAAKLSRTQKQVLRHYFHISLISEQ